MATSLSSGWVVSAINWVKQWTLMFNSGFRSIWKLIWIRLHQLAWVKVFSYKTGLPGSTQIPLTSSETAPHAGPLWRSPGRQGPLCLSQNQGRWAHPSLASLRATHLPGQYNDAEDELLRQRIHPEKWHQKWDKFGRAHMDHLFPIPNQTIIKWLKICVPAPDSTAHYGNFAPARERNLDSTAVCCWMSSVHIHQCAFIMVTSHYNALYSE